MAERDIHRPDAEGYISGVFNYCDRRCEKCRFILQCRVGAMEASSVDPDREPGEEGVEDYMERLTRMMDTMADAGDEDEEDKAPRFNLEEMSADDDDDDAETEEEFRAKDERIRTRIEQHELDKLSRAYMDMVREWIDEREEGLKARGVTLHRSMELHIDPRLRTPDILVLSEAVDEVLWFERMLHVKCNRALRGKIEDPEWMEEFDMDPLQSDWNGTAKLALHIVDRCLQAWGTINELMPGEADATVAIMEALHRCKAELDREFPEAHKFIRAGFDAHMGSPKE